MDKTYKPGDNVIPHLDQDPASDDDDLDEQRMLAQARELSLNDVGISNTSTHRSRQRQPHHPPRHARQSDALSHQSSLRSLLSQSDVDLGDMEDEIMRHILDHGLLDGVDLNNLTPAQEDAITDSIARTFRSRRRRDRDRDRHRDRDRDHSAAHRHSPTYSSPRHSPHPSSHRHSPSASAHRRAMSNTSALIPQGPPPVQSQPAPTRRRATSANHPHRINTPSDGHRYLIPTSSSRPLNHSSPALPMSPPQVSSTNVSAPSVSCSRCEKPNLQFSLHYNCDGCSDGDFNLCLECYRAGKGCLDWYGFGRAALARYRPSTSEPADHDRPHVLSARRYSQSTGRLEQGLFCEGCFAFADSCYWHCNTCLEGAWGYCNACVQQGKHCTHPLASVAHASQAPSSPHRHSRTDHARDLYPPPLTIPNSTAFHFDVPSTPVPVLPHVPDPSSYTALTLASYCDVCHYSIPPSHARFHCNTCNKGNYDICTSCYHSLVNTGKVHRENGPAGWRRCLRGHRMSVIGHEDREGGPKRVVVREMVGGWALKDDDAATSTTSPTTPQQQQDSWRWKEDDGTPATQVSKRTSFPAHLLPPDGGVGMRAQALWSYFPGSDVKDELSFPRNAVVGEVEDINGDWFWGVFAGCKGLFPGNYVRVVGSRAV